MLTTINIRDFAIIERLTLDLSTGFTIMTGETGAGKSILLDAMGLVLGDRADSQAIRHGCKRAEISADFDINQQPEVQQWLLHNELDDDEMCQLRRTIALEGRSKAYINGRSVPISLLKDLGSQLVEIHGQNEHLSLLHSGHQRDQLDTFGQYDKLCVAVKAAYQSWANASKAYETAKNSAEDRDQQLGFLQFQVSELESLNISANEITQLSEDHKRYANAEQIITSCQTALNVLDQSDQSIDSQLSHVYSDLLALQAIDPALTAATELLNSASISIREAVSEVQHHLDGMDIDPARLQQIEQRLGAVVDMARKHHLKAEALPDHFEDLKAQLATLKSLDENIAQLEIAEQQAATTYLKDAKRLSDKRRQSAKKLGAAVSGNMQELGMVGGRLEIQIESNDQPPFSAFGLDQVSYLVTANASQPVKPLRKVASGGELSRISLAIAVITAQKTNSATLVFDEVDVGVGGKTAEIVGQMLAQLGQTQQVICITHLPQVAAQGQHHLHVNKQNTNKATTTAIATLSIDERCEEVARMLGGIEITPQTRAHAREMIDRSQQNVA